MVELIKINGGLVKSPNSEGNYFLNTERYFTNNLFTIDVNGEYIKSGLPYEKSGSSDVLVELEDNILLMVLSELTVDGIKFNSQDEFINYVFH